MATIGLSKPFYAIYNADSSTVTYSNGGLLGKYTNLSLELDDADDNILYADNAPDETEPGFAGGTVTVTTNDLLASVAKVVLGLKQEAISAAGVTTEGAAWNVYDDDQNPPYVGLGGVVEKKVSGVRKYVAFVLCKIKFKNPGKTIATRGSTVEWQTPEISATILRSDEPKHRWYMDSTELDTEAEAVAAVKGYLSIA